MIGQSPLGHRKALPAQPVSFAVQAVLSPPYLLPWTPASKRTTSRRRTSRLGDELMDLVVDFFMCVPWVSS
jgi:hypothetical protein